MNNQIDLSKITEQAEKLRLCALIVIKDGERIAEYFPEEEIRRNIYSGSKSYTSTAVGMAVQEGLIRLDEKLTDAFADSLPDQVGENLEKATVRDLLTMCLGQDEPHLMGKMRLTIQENDWVKASLAYPWNHQPNTEFVYNNVGPYLAGVLVQKRSGCDLVHYLMPRLFEPMGIRMPVWEVDPLGYTFGAGGLFLAVSEYAQLAQLYLDGGVWEGKRLLSEEWTKEATRRQVDNGREGYGYLFWRGAYNTFMADGKWGQYAIGCPDKRTVIACASECREADKLKALLLDTILPQV